MHFIVIKTANICIYFYSLFRVSIFLWWRGCVSSCWLAAILLLSAGRRQYLPSWSQQPIYEALLIERRKLHHCSGPISCVVSFALGEQRRWVGNLPCRNLRGYRRSTTHISSPPLISPSDPLHFPSLWLLPNFLTQITGSRDGFNISLLKFAQSNVNTSQSCKE